MSCLFPFTTIHHDRKQIRGQAKTDIDSRFFNEGSFGDRPFFRYQQSRQADPSNRARENRLNDSPPSPPTHSGAFKQTLTT